MKRMKKALIPVLVLCCVLTACKGKNDAQTEAVTESETESVEVILSEIAMENFLTKVEEGNYVINAENYLKTSVASKDLVTFEYVDDMYNDFAIMSVENEAFQAFLSDDGLGEVKFAGEGQAVDEAKDRLLSYWLDEDVSQGNIYNLFYNIQEDPLRFMSKEDVVKQSLISFVGYGDNALQLMHEVYLVLDDEDPTEVHLQAEMDEDMVARVNYDDIDVTVTFGNAEGDARVQAWMDNPKYPEARTDWTETDEFILNSVFLPGYGLQAVPFPSFASYAMVNDENFLDNDEVNIRDSRASEQGMQDYIAVLKENGFAEVTEEDENGETATYYRRMLREDYDCYSSIHLEYDDGVNLTARKYYDSPVYNNLEEINEAIGQIGYPALSSSEDLKVLKATDTANEMTESWLYFFDYEMGLYVETEYQDYDAAMAYLNAYGEELTATGFQPVYSGDTEEVDRYESEDELSSFRYHFDEDGTLTLLYKAERKITADEAETMIQEAGFPVIELADDITCRDLRQFAKMRYDQDLKAYLTVSQTFDSTEEAESFLDNYEAALNEAGFGRVNPDEVGSLKAIAIYNEETGMLVAIDFFEEDGGALVNFDFKAE